MATYVEILKNEFPEIDSEVFDYITGERPRPELNPEHNSAAARWHHTPGSDLRLRPGVRPSFGANGLTLPLRVDQRGFGQLVLRAQSGPKRQYTGPPVVAVHNQEQRSNRAARRPGVRLTGKQQEVGGERPESGSDAKLICWVRVGFGLGWVREAPAASPSGPV